MQLSILCIFLSYEREYAEDGSISEEDPPQNLIKGTFTSASDFQPSAPAPGEIHGGCSQATDLSPIPVVFTPGEGRFFLPSFPEELGEDCLRKVHRRKGK